MGQSLLMIASANGCSGLRVWSRIHFARRDPDNAGSDLVPDGPRVWPDVDKWAIDMVQRMLDGQVATKWATDITLVVTVKWAGCGGMYIAVLYAIQALEAIYHKRIKVELDASSDWEARCQDMLLCFEEGHIFQDMLDQYNEVLVEGIKQKQNAAYHKLETFMKQRTTYTQRQAKKAGVDFRAQEADLGAGPGARQEALLRRCCVCRMFQA